MHEPLHRPILLYSQRRYDLAETELRRVLTEDPQNAMALSWLGLTLAQLEKFDEAESSTQAAIALAPDSAFALYTHAWVLHDRCKFSQAEDAIHRALKLDPFSPEYLALLAQIRVDRKNWTGALEAAEQGLALDAESVDCNNLRAIALVNLGRQTEAAATLQTNLQNDPDDAVTHANLGWTCLHQGDANKAISHFREALRLDASSEWAQTGLIEAMKARFWPYRLLLRFFLWFSKFSDGVKVAVLLGAYFGNMFLRQIEAANPKLAPFISPVTITYLIFVLIVWFAVPLANLCLMVHPLGRLALKPDDKLLAVLIGLCVLGCGWGYVGGHLMGMDWHYLFGLACLFLMFPLMGWHCAPAGSVKRFMLIYLLALVALITIVLSIWYIDPMRRLGTFWDIYRWGCVLSTFTVQLYPFKSIVR